MVVVTGAIVHQKHFLIDWIDWLLDLFLSVCHKKGKPLKIQLDYDLVETPPHTSDFTSIQQEYVRALYIDKWHGVFV